MLLSNIEHVPGHRIERSLGLVRGSTVRARNVGRDILANFRNLIGGEITEYTKLQAEAREQALQRMIQEAQYLKGNAIIGIRMTTSMIAQGASEIVIYGTAVVVSQNSSQNNPD